MLLGTYPAKFVSGHRLAIPAPLRRSLGEKFILARWYEGCLVLIAGSDWEALYKRLTGGENLIVTPIRDTERFILASAYEVIPDSQGRIVVPERLIQYSHLSEDVYFIGLGDKIEIWDKETWVEREKEVVNNAASFIEELSKKGRNE
jgi:MraZ protein